MTHRILFRAESAETGLELMAFDATTGRFGPIIDINEGPGDGVEANASPAWTGKDTFLLPATDGTLATNAVFRTDGTAAGTTQVPDADIGSDFFAPVQSDGRLFYTSSAGFMSVGPDGQEVQVLPASSFNSPLQIDGAYTQTISAATSRMIYSLPGQADWTVYDQQPGDGVNFVIFDAAKSAAREGSILHWLGVDSGLQLVTDAGVTPVDLPAGRDLVANTGAVAVDDGYVVLLSGSGTSANEHRVWHLDPGTLVWSVWDRTYGTTELANDFGEGEFIPGSGILTVWTRINAEVPEVVVYVNDNPFGPITVGNLVDLTGSVAVTADGSLHAFTAVDLNGDELLYRGFRGPSGGGTGVALNLTDAGHSGPVEMMAVGSAIYFVLEPSGGLDQLWRIEGANAPEFLADTDVDLRAFAGAVDYNAAPEGDWFPGAALRETAGSGTVVGRVEASDPDGDTLSYTLLGDAATRGTFAVRADGTVVTTGPLDFETRETYAAGVRVSDGDLSTVVDVPISVRDVDETPPAPPSGGGGGSGPGGSSGGSSGPSAPPGPTNGDDILRGTPGNDTIDGLGGNDRIDGLTGLDRLGGSQGFDVINGGGGDDTINGGAGFDTLNGGAGNDVIKGNAGNDMLDGGIGADTLDGGIGADTIFGKGGADSISGSDGFDTLYGNASNDEMKGNNGNDTMFGGQGFDQMDGGLGADRMFGDSGSDTMLGKGGNDTLYGGAGDDELFGNAANDIIDGGTGNDTLFGGQGADRFVFRKGYGKDVIADMQEVDEILLEGTAFGVTNEAALAGLITDAGPAWRLDFGGGDILTVQKPVAGGTLDVSDFVLV